MKLFFVELKERKSDIEFKSLISGSKSDSKFS
jgi:hypothetical protein